MPYKPFPCPKCSRLLQPEGELDFAGETFPVYQCEDCLVMRDTFNTGTPIEGMFTFYLNSDGLPVDPNDPDAMSILN